MDDELRSGKYRRSKLISLLWDMPNGVVYGPASISVREKLTHQALAARTGTTCARASRRAASASLRVGVGRSFLLPGPGEVCGVGSGSAAGSAFRRNSATGSSFRTTGPLDSLRGRP